MRYITLHCIALHYIIYIYIYIYIYIHIYIYIYIYIFEGSLEVKLPTIRTDGEAEVGRVRDGKGQREKKE